MTTFKKQFFQSEDLVAQWFEGTLTKARGYQCGSSQCPKFGTIYPTMSSTAYPTYLRFDLHDIPLNQPSNVEWKSNCTCTEVDFPAYQGNPYQDHTEFKVSELLTLFKQNTGEQKTQAKFLEELQRITGRRSKIRSEHNSTRGIYSKSNVWYLQGYQFIDEVE